MTLGRRSRFWLPFLGALAAFAALAPTAGASFHLIKVREVYPGTQNDSYVELQMYAAGQTFLSGHSMTLYGPTGTLTHTSTFSSGVAGADNQRTVLIGAPGVEAKFGVKPDLVDTGLSIPAAGGAACWNALGIPADCVAWGNFSGAAALQSATGTSAGSPASPGGITAGKAIRRSIEPGCPTLLEESDDSDDSATDFKEATPAPRNNASVPAEMTCVGAPETAIDDRPALNSNSPDAEFTYDAPTATSYECRLDGAAFASCPAIGKQYTGLADGSHTFQVRGVNGSGPDPTPASFTWKVDTVAPSATIDSHPVDPSPGKTAAFTFHANETGAKFECSLAKGAAADSFSTCASGQKYSNLADGAYTFKVRATDLATNQQPTPTAFSWQVDNSLADLTPPETTLDSRPPDPSTATTASFTYHSNESGSSFECALDSAAFAPCPAAGITYSGLAAGPHGFQVRAIDPSENTDPSPAGYSFNVVLPAGTAPFLPQLPAPPLAAGPAATPETSLIGKPAATTRDRTPSFRFRSDQATATFQCAIDHQAFKACRSPFTTKRLGFGRHSFAVRAVAAGAADPSPATQSFKVVRGRRTHG
jgi:hypothetical protein